MHRITAEVTEELLGTLQEYCNLTGLSKASVLKVALLDYLKKYAEFVLNSSSE